jgi:phosphoglycerate dehydrogenase-like enzyme
MAKMVFCIYQHYIDQLDWMKKELEAQGHEVILVPPATDLTPYMKDTDTFSLGWEFIDGKFMDKCPRLVHLNTFAVAYNHLDIAAAAERGITCSNTPGANKLGTAEIAVSLMLAAARHSATSHKYMHQGKWWQRAGVNLHGKTVGILGTGNIGSEVARILHHGFQMKVIAYDVVENEALKKECDIQYMSVDEVVSQAYFVTVHVPVLPETTHMMDERRFRMMKKTAIFINASRGVTNVERDLEKAI